MSFPSTLFVSGIRVWKIRTYAKSLNATWDDVDADYWSVLEANTSVFCLCMVSILSCVLSACLLRVKACSSPLFCSPHTGMEIRSGDTCCTTSCGRQQPADSKCTNTSTAVTEEVTWSDVIPHKVRQAPTQDLIGNNRWPIEADARGLVELEIRDESIGMRERC
jgi:hypothetical protein